MNSRALSILLSFLLLLLIIELFRRERLNFKYAAPWIVIAVLGMIFAKFDVLLYRLSKLLGFELTSNFIFFSILGGFVFLSLLLTIFLCQQNDRNDKMAQKIGLLDHEIEKLKKTNN